MDARAQSFPNGSNLQENIAGVSVLITTSRQNRNRCYFMTNRNILRVAKPFLTKTRLPAFPLRSFRER